MGAASEKSVSVGDILHGATRRAFSLRAVMAEFVGMWFFVLSGCGAAVFFSATRASLFAAEASDTTGSRAAAATTEIGAVTLKSLSNLNEALKINASFGIVTALAFGIGIVVIAYSIGHISGGHLNAAVTISLVCSGNCSIIQGIANIIAQGAGSTLAAGFLYGMVPNPSDSSLGANGISEGISTGNAFLGEAVMTCLLCFVVHMTAVDKKNPMGSNGFAPLAIGFAVFLGHAVLIPVDGCSINPTRSFGPALVSNTWNNFWVFVVGPIVGGIVAVPLWWIVSQPALDKFTVDDSKDGNEAVLSNMEPNELDTPDVKTVSV